MALVVEIIGWTGAVLMLTAYMLVSMGRMRGTAPPFQWMNAVGAACFVVNTWWHGAIPSMVVNAIWSGIGFWGLWRGWRLVQAGRA